MTIARGPYLAALLANAMPLFERFLVGFDDANLTAQAPNLPNHAAWTLGHLALTATRSAHRIAGHDQPQPLPDADFTTPNAAPDHSRFDPESVAFSSVPVDDPARYPSWQRCTEIYRNGHQRLIAALDGADDASLDRLVPYGASTITAEQTGLRMIVHLGTHTGQIVDLRRALGLPRILG